MLDELRFDVVHVAMYSPRPGTVAATEMGDDVPREEKKRRLHAVEELQKRIATEINARYLGRTVEVLVEGQSQGPLVRPHAHEQAGPFFDRDDRWPARWSRCASARLARGRCKATW